jgi:hypothetical protein
MIFLPAAEMQITLVKVNTYSGYYCQADNQANVKPIIRNSSFLSFKILCLGLLQKV